MKRNLRVIVWILSVAGILLLLVSAFMHDREDKLLWFYMSGTVLLADLICFALYMRKPGLFKDKSNNETI